MFTRCTFLAATAQSLDRKCGARSRRSYRQAGAAKCRMDAKHARLFFELLVARSQSIRAKPSDGDVKR